MSDAVGHLVIDADGHVFEPAELWPRYLDEAFRARAPRLHIDEVGTPCQVAGDTKFARTALRLASASDGSLGEMQRREGGWNPEERLRAMDAEGIDAVVLFPTYGMYFSEVSDPQLEVALCRAYNDWLCDFCQVSPERLVGVGVLPLRDVDASIRELTRATCELDFRGAFVRPNPYAGRPIHDPAYEPFWECAESIGASILVHEGISDGMPTLGRERFPNPAMLHVLCHPFEQMAACAGLILAGVLERYPKLMFAFLECGSGWLPFWLDRLDGHFETWPAFFPGLKAKPSEYFRRQCFVSCEADDDSVYDVVARVGDQNVVWASDYPHPDGLYPNAVRETVRRLSRLPEVSRRRVLADNAARLYDLETTETGLATAQGMEG